MIKKWHLRYVFLGLFNSYSQIFFSLNKVLAIISLIVSFFSVKVGLSGLCAVLLSNGIAHVMGFEKREIQSGIWGFNALFFGLAFGYDFEFNLMFVLLFVTSIFILLMITSWLKGVLATKKLPFLSFPFLITYWIISLASTNFTNIHIDDSHVYIVNEAVLQQMSAIYRTVHIADTLSLPFVILSYFKTIAGAFFQNSVLGGMLIAFGLLYSSRISFSLSIIGFMGAYYSYQLFGAQVSDLNYNLMGINFIFFSIAIGCFFLISNKYSYLAVVLLTPVLMILLIFLNKVLAVFQLKAFTLSFCILTVAFLFFLYQRWLHKFLIIVEIQYYSAEKTIYKHITFIQRFKNEHLAKISLPFWGDWLVSQGYHGNITHLGDWGNALDFMIIDSQNRSYHEPGIVKEDFYCFNKPILAPLDGYIYDIVNNIEDNDISTINTEKNWGNAIIINHANGLFSQLNHIKKDSFKVSVGDYVTKGTIIAACGNSGRSPEPHIHFQIQTTPVIGAKTYPYPISYFIEKKNDTQNLVVSSIPKEGTIVSNVEISKLMCDSFQFIIEKKVSFRTESNLEMVSWGVHTDAWNRSYIYCEKSKSYAYFVNDGTMFYFTDFEGNRKSLLFYFYLANYRQLLGCYEGIKLKDNVPLIHFNNKWINWLQDFVAPFYLFTTAEYCSGIKYIDNMLSPQTIILESKVAAKFMSKTFRKMNFEIELKNNRIESFTIKQHSKIEKYICATL
jgi:urea transporter/murein DD-endopeptidase MepM/ murein hydrolase activator NlpD